MKQKPIKWVDTPFGKMPVQKKHKQKYNRKESQQRLDDVLIGLIHFIGFNHFIENFKKNNSYLQGEDN